MKSMPSCALAKFASTQINAEEIKRDGWNTHRILVVCADDSRLSAIEKQIIEQIGAKLYGHTAGR